MRTVFHSGLLTQEGVPFAVMTSLRQPLRGDLIIKCATLVGVSPPPGAVQYHTHKLALYCWSTRVRMFSGIVLPTKKKT
jgi:hypothetical protein